MSDKPNINSDQKTDATGEFFSVGTPLHAVRAGYVSRDADEELFQQLMSGGNAYVIAPDRSGKSSLIASLSARLKSRDVTVAVIDLEQISERDGGTDAGRWYYNIAYRLSRQLRLKTDLQSWWQDKSMLSNRQRLVEFYLEVVLSNIDGRVVVFIDEIQCIERLPAGEDLLASVRAAHNARVTDPEFARLGFVLLGECDPHGLVSHDSMSPFAAARQIKLGDFTREQLSLFRTELNLPAVDADAALDRIYFWTNGQPYLTQKLARAVAREDVAGDVDENVDRIALQQLAGRSALHNEPHLSHLHREIVNDKKDSEALLTQYGKLRKGVPVGYEPESRVQRKLLASGLVVVAPGGKLAPRNRIYATVFTAKWANDNLSIHWRGPAIAAALVFLIAAIPFWYTQILPKSYVRVLSEPAVEMNMAANAYDGLRSFPGHASSADRLYEGLLEKRASRAATPDEIHRIRSYANRMPDGQEFSLHLLAEFWQQQMRIALRNENRDMAIVAALESLVESSPEKRRLAANIIGNDYPQLLGTAPASVAEQVIYDRENNLISFATGAQLSQWSLSDNMLQQRATWSLTALEVSPLLRRLPVELNDSVRQVGLSMSMQHGRSDDIRAKLIAPSGRSVELDFAAAGAGSGGALEFSSQQFRAFAGEATSGTWTLSIRDESTTVPGSLLGWSLTINGRAHADIPERPLPIPDPVARESNDVWLSPGGRFAVARAMNSDSARVWDLLYAQPARSIAVQADERVLGLDSSAELLVTVRQDSAQLWSTRDGRRAGVLEFGSGYSDIELSADGQFLLLIRRADVESDIDIWSVAERERIAGITVAGPLALHALSRDGRMLAVADYDRAIRVWELPAGELLAQFDLASQPSSIQLAADGKTVGVVHGEQGYSLWSVSSPDRPLLQEAGRADWALAFSPSGSRLIAGNGNDGYRIYRTQDGAIIGAPIGGDVATTDGKLLAFANDEQFVVTAHPQGPARLWRAAGAAFDVDGNDADAWRDVYDTVSVLAPGGQMFAIGDRYGHVHIESTAGQATQPEDIQVDLSFIGHSDAVAAMTFSDDGSSIASIDVAGGVRVWDAQSGMPSSYRARIAAATVDQMAFSPGAGLLAITSGSQLWVMEADSGEFVAVLDTGEIQSSIAFASDSELYVAGASGSLRKLTADRADSWSLQSVWNIDSGLQYVAVSPKRNLVLLVDNLNIARVLDVANGQVGSASLELPGAVSEIVLSPSETRVLIRTSRWVHRAGLSAGGLVWLDAMRTPRLLPGSSIVVDAGKDGAADSLGNNLAVLTRDSGVIRVAELDFEADNAIALIGTHSELVNEWRRKLNIDPPAN